MTYHQLLEFVQEYMPKRMQHIYLPLLVGELVDSDGSATIRQLAEAVLAKDESQVMYYEKTTQGDAITNLEQSMMLLPVRVTWLA